MAGEIKWIKVITDIFEDEKIKLIKSMPEGRTLVLIWFQLLAQAGKTNASGWIYLNEGCAYTSSMLATLFNETQQMIELALRLYSTQPFEMIEITETGLIYIPNWEKHQNVESMDKIREKERLRKAKQREKNKLALKSRDSHGTGHGTSLQCHATDIELELEKEKDTTTTTTEPPVNPFRLFESEGFGTLSSVIGEKIGDFIDDYGERWVCEAMKQAAYYGKRNLPYVKSILDRYRTSGVDEPWKEEKGAKEHEKPGGVAKGFRPGGHAPKSNGNDGESKFYPSKWDNAPLPKVSG